MDIFKFWRNAASGAEVSSEEDDVRTEEEEEEFDDEDSLFDLAFKSPDRRNKHSNKDFHFIESPRDVLLTKNSFSDSKFKVFMLGFKKSSKCGGGGESNADLKVSPLSKLEQSNRFSVTPVFARDNSLRSKMLKESAEFETSSSDVSSEKSVPKYLKLIKPFYSSKAKSTDSSTPSSSPVTALVNLSPRKFSEGSRIGSFKIVTRNLGKSRSASAAIGVAPPSIRRIDDSLLEQHDGIQGAILHCKKSFNSSSSQEYSQLFRAASDPSHEKLRNPWRNSFEEQKRCSI